MDNNQLTVLEEAGGANNVTFPLHVFPEPLREYINESADAINCPADFISMAVLSSFSLAVGSKVVADVKNIWKESPVLFSAIVAEPGAKKTPALKAGALAVFQLQQELAQIYATRKQAYIKNNEEFDKAFEKWRSIPKAKREFEDKPVKPIPPTLEQITTNDATIEGLSALLQKQPLRILFIQDELAGWVKGMNQYRQGNGADQEKWLSLWSCEDIIINRKSEDEAIYIRRPFVSVLGCLQPDVLNDFSKGKDNGFLDRILFVVPGPVKLEFTNKQVEEYLKCDYIKAFKRMYFFNYKDENPAIIEFSPTAYQKLEDYMNDCHYREMNSDELPYYLRGIWSKFVGYTIRFSIIIEAMKYGYSIGKLNKIELSSVEKAIELTEYFKIQAKKVQNILHSSTMDKKIEMAIQKIKKLGGTISLRNFYQRKIAGCKNKTSAENLVSEMIDRSLVETEKIRPKTGGKETILIKLIRDNQQPDI
ncbi:DUF3987 domain-containing protein [Marinifilum caeruleilacunae]|uniref:DUF3987 domain-containing protein n=1 Tax=Marinifilum caeruleilacunae TaxID=2499076 RepID=A0ABX1X212_9BACT|nr:DUF3987 domain-containing protein [Marinifilum caeruleilacunae]NOU62286.1 DUF3987 domain-containing protein [Marinifilum caeruleilacunae]